MKETADVLAYPLSKIINLLKKLYVFPEEWEVDELKPLSKKGSKTGTKDYKTILLVCSARIIEKSIRVRREYHLISIS